LRLEAVGREGRFAVPLPATASCLPRRSLRRRRVPATCHGVVRLVPATCHGVVEDEAGSPAGTKPEAGRRKTKFTRLRRAGPHNRSPMSKVYPPKPPAKAGPKSKVNGPRRCRQFQGFPASLSIENRKSAMLLCEVAKRRFATKHESKMPPPFPPFSPC